MDKYNTIIELYKNNTPFCIVRYNDGEMMGIDKIGCKIARGDQIVNNELHEHLIRCLNHKQNNYWIGKPCSTCFKHLHEVYKKYIKNYEFETHAVILCNNGHWNKFINDFKNNINDRRIIWVSGDDQNIKNLPFKIDKHYKLQRKDSWSQYKEIKCIHENFKSDDIVIISCGPTSRILACDWYQLHDDCTIIDAGSTFDPFTRNVWHKCHTNELKYCKECNFN